MPETRTAVEPGHADTDLAMIVARAGTAPEDPSTDRRRWRRPLLGIPFAVLAGSFGLGQGELERPIREPNQRADVRRRDAIFRRSLALADLVAAASAALLVTGLAGHALAPVALLGLPLVVLVGKIVGSYD